MARKREDAQRRADGAAGQAPERVVCTEHVRSNLLVGLGSELLGAVSLVILSSPLWGASGWTRAFQVVLLAIVGITMVMGVIELLGYFNKRIEMDAEGITYTSSLRRAETHPWADVIAYDTREDLNSLELVFGNKRRTFHKSSENYEQMVDFVIDHTELISVK